MQILHWTTELLYTITKAEKWLCVKCDVEYSFLWLMYSVTSLSKIETLLHNRVTSREVIQQRLTDLQNELESEVSRLRTELDPATVQIEQTSVKPRKTDIDVRTVALLWVPS